ncbi:MAG: hypothetical protein KAI51_01120 [Candidatus Aenigmarchaeota archaeon]|nr:hypothetical protein [Candidatus Aenigmarchaeota archaeon]MCK5063180.1 hypothetical protein [Candidatus Aenigmarchaeota archaeon]MCK5289837.1 hypothetical protein [Candidatus Aenigmarchaeota archaeon]MCK5452012.1 hypothetical protein [Candidatus Aenigmarchaeota archaeon]
MELIPALMIGFGLFLIYIIVIKNDEKFNDFKVPKNIILALILIGIGGYVIFSSISSAVLMKKFIGLVLTLLGFFLVFKFPYMSEYNRGFEVTGIFFGVVILIVGLIVLIF